MEDDDLARRGVVITNREIYDLLLDVRDRVKVIETEKMPTRVRALELKFYAILAGLITALGGAAIALNVAGGVK